MALSLREAHTARLLRDLDDLTISIDQREIYIRDPVRRAREFGSHGAVAMEHEIAGLTHTKRAVLRELEDEGYWGNRGYVSYPRALQMGGPLPNSSVVGRGHAPSSRWLADTAAMLEEEASRAEGGPAGDARSRPRRDELDELRRERRALEQERTELEAHRRRGERALHRERGAAARERDALSESLRPAALAERELGHVAYEAAMSDRALDATVELMASAADVRQARRVNPRPQQAPLPRGAASQTWERVCPLCPLCPLFPL